MLADETALPVDPREHSPQVPCQCGSTSFKPEEDVMDTWATSSLSPQIVGGWLADPALYDRVFPFSLRPQAHEIIRTWAFYTIVKSQYHFDALPWTDVAISGWGVVPEGTGKISKSRGGGPMSPLEMIELHSADAVRYWAASTGPGKDAIISEEKVQLGAKLVTKLWNVARFSQRFLARNTPAPAADEVMTYLSPADRWILARTQRLIRRVTELFQGYDYAAAKSETEVFFWRDLADNYLEMAKVRLYGEQPNARAGAQYALYRVLLTTLKLFAPFLPYVTEEIYQHLFKSDGAASIHLSRWPVPTPQLEDDAIEAFGETLIAIATAVRRYKSEHNLPLGTEIALLQLAVDDAQLSDQLRAAMLDVRSITRAQQIKIGAVLDATLEIVPTDGRVRVALSLV